MLHSQMSGAGTELLNNPEFDGNFRHYMDVVIKIGKYIVLKNFYEDKYLQLKTNKTDVSNNFSHKAFVELAWLNIFTMC